MKVELFPFQKTALARLRQSVATALGNYRSTHTPQVVSYTAPTGAGKTIVMSCTPSSPRPFSFGCPIPRSSMSSRG